MIEGSKDEIISEQAIKLFKICETLDFNFLSDYDRHSVMLEDINNEISEIANTLEEII